MATLTRIHWRDAYLDAAQFVAPEEASQDLTSSLPVQVLFCLYDLRKDQGMRRHDYLDLTYLYHGNTLFRLNNRAYRMREGDLILINNAQYHSLEQEGSALVKTVTLRFKPEALLSYEPRRNCVEYLSPFLNQDPNFVPVVDAHTGIPALILSFIQEIKNELPATTSRAHLSVRAYLQMILVKLINHYSTTEPAEQAPFHRHKASERLYPLFNYLYEHYEEALTSRHAARIVHMSDSHFRHCFKEVTGLSFVQYLNEFRITRAQLLLGSTGQPVSQVAQEVGFGNQSHFGRLFKKLVNLSPTEYRTQIRVSGRKSRQIASGRR